MADKSEGKKRNIQVDPEERAMRRVKTITGPVVYVEPDILIWRMETLDEDGEDGQMELDVK